LSRCLCLVALIALIALATALPAAARPGIAGLQVALRAQGLYAGAIDAVYGAATARGLRQFQRRTGLAADGRVGPATRHALGQLGLHSFGSRTLRRGATGWDVSVAQFLLTQHGQLLPIDGNFGRRTEAALRRFQRTHKLNPDGIAGPRTLSALTRVRAKRFVRVSSVARSADVPSLIDYWAARYRVDAALMHALAWMESGYQPHLTSSVGATGVMQIRPTTWQYVESVLLRRKIPPTVSGNIQVGVVLMRELLREFDSDTPSALAAWYQGPASVRRHGRFRVTKMFVADVLALRRRFA
jgi:Putative peptidoglycan binding domain/Transglycosylase SLT domain